MKDLTEPQRALLTFTKEILEAHARTDGRVQNHYRFTLRLICAYQWAESYEGGKRSLRLPWSPTAMRMWLIARSERHRGCPGLALDHVDGREGVVEKLTRLRSFDPRRIRPILETARAAVLEEREHLDVEIARKHPEQSGSRKRIAAVEALFRENNLTRLDRLFRQRSLRQELEKRLRKSRAFPDLDAFRKYAREQWKDETVYVLTSAS